MTRSMRESNYIGTFVYSHGQRLEAMRIAHRAGAEGQRERLVSLTGKRREIIRDGENVTCVLADRDEVVVDRRKIRNPLTDLLPESSDELDDHYILETAGDGRVANREVVRVRIQSRDRYRYGYELAIDRDTGLLLGSELLSGDADSPVEQIMFTNIRRPDQIPDSQLEQQISGDGFVWHRRDPASSSDTEINGDSEWQISSPPDGFRLVRRQRHTLPGRDAMVEHWLYTDGLASVSVYIERMGEAAGTFHGRSAMGALNVYGRKIGAHQVVVVGEVPVTTVEAIGESIRRRDRATP